MSYANRLIVSLIACLLVSPVQPARAQSEGGLMGGLGGGAPIEITAEESLEWHEPEQMYAARGAAKAVRGDFTVTADQLFAYQKKNAQGQDEIVRLVAEGNVHIASARQEAWGQRAVYDVTQKVAVLTGSGLKFAGNDTVVTARDRLEYWEAQRKAVARGNAIASQNDRRVEADVLTAQFVELPNGKQELEQMLAQGNVTVVTKTDVARGEKAVYDMRRDIAIMSGGVRVTRGQSQLEGAVAEVDFATGLSRIMSNGSRKAGDGRVRALLVPDKK
ncbi:MAG: hypothetical protein GC131_05380 [Alphaproteobacteria bacterium]|nr:hypothetical protein [Alphaproteobacteria bacterium]